MKEKIIPAFEAAHGPRYQAAFLIDHSQGHAAYATDALRVSEMNFKPGGKQAVMRDGWFINDAGEKITQSMNYPSDHPTWPKKPKGMLAVLTERGLSRPGLKKECKICDDSNSCCAKVILARQPDFQSQRSSIQEIIEERGHMCIMLPKYHCELNFIEFFWGAVKKYLRDNCDYTFNGLKERMPLALESVQISTIRKWEHRMYRWMDAYRQGMNCKDAQFEVRKFSSTLYKSHRRVPETLAQTFDA
jgi:hypothetical protein